MIPGSRNNNLKKKTLWKNMFQLSVSLITPTSDIQLSSSSSSCLCHLKSTLFTTLKLEIMQNLDSSELRVNIASEKVLFFLHYRKKKNRQTEKRSELKELNYTFKLHTLAHLKSDSSGAQLKWQL